MLVESSSAIKILIVLLFSLVNLFLKAGSKGMGGMGEACESSHLFMDEES